MIRSIATVKSSSVTASPLRRVATMAASLTSLGGRRRGEAGCQPGDLVEIDVRGKLHLGDVHFQDFATPGAVGAVDQHLAIKPPGTQQGGIEHLRANRFRAAASWLACADPAPSARCDLINP